MKLGIFGGTFNPIHNSHLYIAGEFREKLGLDKILVIPTYTPPHKPADNLADSAHRLAMCRLAVEGDCRYEVLEYEIQKGGKSYTCKTLEYIHRQFPHAELYLIMGTDMFLSVQDWKSPEKIYARAVLCAAQREDNALEAMVTHKKVLERQGARCRLIDISAKPLSSTLVRDRLRLGEDVSHLVPGRVLTYIQEHNLYR